MGNECWGIWFPSFKRWLVRVDDTVVIYESEAGAAAHILNYHGLGGPDGVEARRIGRDGNPIREPSAADILVEIERVKADAQIAQRVADRELGALVRRMEPGQTLYKSAHGTQYAVTYGWGCGEKFTANGSLHPTPEAALRAALEVQP